MPQWKKLWLVGCCLCFVGVGGWLLRSCSQSHIRSVDQSEPAFDVTRNGRQIVFSTQGKGDRDLYMLHVKERQIAPLTNTIGYEGDPAFSDDSEKIAYVVGSPNDRADHVFIRVLQTGDVIQITSKDYNDSAPSFSSNGKFIVFVRDHVYKWGGLGSSWGYDQDLYLINLKSGQLSRLTQSHFLSIKHPQFINNDTAIVFTGISQNSLKQISSTNSNISGDIYILKHINTSQSTSGKLIRLTNKSMFNFSDVSPDERQILLVTNQGSIQTMNIDGTNRRQVGKKSFNAASAIWSNKSEIFYLSYEMPDGISNKYALWRINLKQPRAVKVVDSKLFEAPLTPKPF